MNGVWFAAMVAALVAAGVGAQLGWQLPPMAGVKRLFRLGRLRSDESTAVPTTNAGTTPTAS